jgi:hypothetical protein
LIVWAREHLKNRGFLEQGDAQDLQDFVKAPWDAKFLFQNGCQHLDADGDPNLSLHRVLGIPVEGFDSQMLLDPLEEEVYVV